MNTNRFDDGETLGTTVFIKDSELSSVLDKNGDPYTLTKREPLGFRLVKKSNNKEENV